MSERKIKWLPLSEVPEYNTVEIKTMRILHCILAGALTAVLSKGLTDSELLRGISVVASVLIMEYKLNPWAFKVAFRDSISNKNN